jgi:hypothetical protein
MGAQGTATVNFGAFPGASDASVVITGQNAILSSSLVEAWLFPAATADHTHDEHLVETISVIAGNIVAGVGFTIYAVNNSTLFETPPDRAYLPGDTIGYTGPNVAGTGTRIYGVWSVAWVWS